MIAVTNTRQARPTRMSRIVAIVATALVAMFLLVGLPAQASAAQHDVFDDLATCQTAYDQAVDDAAVMDAVVTERDASSRSFYQNWIEASGALRRANHSIERLERVQARKNYRIQRLRDRIQELRGHR